MGPLNGVKVLGFTHFAQAPFALQLLGDLGADVINIERPGTGDFNRTHLSEPDRLGGESPYFLALNRNKRSLSLDMKQEKAKEIIRKLVAKTDVLVTNFRPGVLDKLGFGFEEVKKLNPTIIYAEAVGYGSSGPYAKLPGQDFLAQCMSGYTTIVGPEGPPVSGGTFLIDMYSSAMLSNGIQAALINKMKGGKAQKVEVNLLNSALHLQCQEMSYYLNTGEMPKRPKGFSSQTHSEAPYGIYKTKNGYMGISNVPPEKVELFGKIIGVEGLPALMPSKSVMLKNRDEIYPLVAVGIEKQDTEYWLEQLQAEGFWCTKVKYYDEVVKDPQVVYNKIIQHIDHPTAGDIQVVACPISFSETPAEIHRAPPLLGENNQDILTELGYSEQEIADYQKEGLF